MHLVTFHNCQNWKFYGSTFARHILKGAYFIKVMTDDWQALFSQLSDDKTFSFSFISAAASVQICGDGWMDGQTMQQEKVSQDQKWNIIF